MSDTLPRLAAALASRYRVERELGAGGMATVYLAHDLKHEREVAIKVLHPDLGAALGAERFLSEIKTTAKLQHPHILGLIDSGTADGLLFYVMPFVPGETLRARLQRERQLPVGDAVRLAREVASALDFAHRQGVIHRDIKPENILLQEGSALVADFGIALAVQHAGGARMTQTGLSLGTPQYMSPEQATGERQIDARSDIYSLAAVTYEMLAGEPPFSGPTVQAIVARLMADQPRGISAQRKAVPPHVEAAVFQALEKLPADRFATAAEFSEALRGGTGVRTAAAASLARANAGYATRSPLMLVGAAALTLLCAVGGWWLGRRGASSAQDAPVEFAFRMGASSGTSRNEVAISPDGQRFAQVVRDSTGTNQIAIRDLSSSAVRFVPGAAGAISAYFSPSGDSLVYCGQELGLRRIAVTGGNTTLLATGVTCGVMDWAQDGFVYFTRNVDGLSRVPAAGGAIEVLVKPNRAIGEFTQWGPQLLPDRERVLYFTYRFPLDSSRIELYSLKTKQRTTLLLNAFNPHFLAPNHLLFMRDSLLMRVAFDVSSGKVQGEPVPVLSNVTRETSSGLAAYGVSNKGTVVYLKDSEFSEASRIIWVDRSGREGAAITPPGPWLEPRIAPNGRTVVMSRFDVVYQLWMYDIARGVLSPLTRGATSSFSPVWTSDARHVMHIGENPVYNIIRTNIETSAVDTVLVSTSDKFPDDIAKDGTRLTFTNIGNDDSVYVYNLTTKTTEPLDTDANTTRSAKFSPDGRWIAFDGITAGVRQVFVRALDSSGRRVQISVSGGDQPRWTKGGRELVFRRGDAMLAAPFNPATGEPGRPAVLFMSPASSRKADGRTVNYDVTPDGERFLLAVAQPRPEALPVVVRTGWGRTLGGRP
jgi:eukaryotic-like serine/threonine-protein kinase